MVYTWYNTFILNLFLGLHNMSSINGYLSNVRFFVCCVAMPHGGISVLQPGIEPGPRQWKHRILTTSPPGSSLLLGFIPLQIQISSSSFGGFIPFFVHFVFFFITFPFPTNYLSIPPPLMFPTQILSRPCLNVFSEWNFWHPYQKWLFAVWPL